jgi:hypothetical protein
LLGKKSGPESAAITRSKQRKAAAKAAISAEANLFVLIVLMPLL